jgi:hypothetical protein
VALAQGRSDDRSGLRVRGGRRRSRRREFVVPPVWSILGSATLVVMGVAVVAMIATL